MMPTDHASEAKRYLKKGLELVDSGNIDDAADAFFHAAVEFEKSQDFRQIAALWEAVAKLSELEDRYNSIVTEKWPLDYHIMESDEWNEQKDVAHKLSWIYSWAAGHRERAGEPNMAYPLFCKAAKKAEEAKYGEADPGWPAGLYRASALDFVRTYGTVDHAPDAVQYIQKGISDRQLVKDGIERMKKHYLSMKDQTRAYQLLAISYRLLKTNLIQAGNLAEAEQFKRKERFALMHYYFHNRSYVRAIAEWLSGSGFMYFILGVFLMILFVFPPIYYWCGLAARTQGEITYPDAMLYSVQSALGIAHDGFYSIGLGKLLTIIEAALSWLGLGVFVWWLTRRLE